MGSDSSSEVLIFENLGFQWKADIFDFYVFICCMYKTIYIYQVWFTLKFATPEELGAKEHDEFACGGCVSSG